jgi:hypothetical protein
MGISKDFLNVSPIAPKIRARIDKWDCIKLKNFCTAKEIVNRVKKQCTEWGKTFASCFSDNGLIPRVHKGLKKLSTK